MSAKTTTTDYAAQRHRMVREQLLGRGIADRRLLSAMEKIPRHLFVPRSQIAHAYDDGPLPIGSGQTISQPYMVARMSELLALGGDSTVLEIGTGSGYQTAVLAELAGQVYTVERLSQLAEEARARLTDLDYTNVEFIVGDGTLGHSSAAPYDAIMVTAAAPSVPPTLRKQLAPGGRMVLPIAAGFGQDLVLIECLADPGEGYRETSILACVFVPLVGEEGYPA